MQMETPAGSLWPMACYLLPHDPLGEKRRPCPSIGAVEGSDERFAGKADAGQPQRKGSPRWNGRAKRNGRRSSENLMEVGIPRFLWLLPRIARQ